MPAERLAVSPIRLDMIFGGTGDASTSNPPNLFWLLQRHQNASVIEQRCAGLSPGSVRRNHQFPRDPWRTSSPLCAGIGFRYTHKGSQPIAVGRLEAIQTGGIIH